MTDLDGKRAVKVETVESYGNLVHPLDGVYGVGIWSDSGGSSN